MKVRNINDRIMKTLILYYITVGVSYKGDNNQRNFVMTFRKDTITRELIEGPKRDDDTRKCICNKVQYDIMQCSLVQFIHGACGPARRTARPREPFARCRPC